MTYFLFSIIVPAIVSILAVNWAYFKILKIAKDKNLVDNPDARKLQKNPIPVMGGIAVFFGVVMGLLAGAMLKNCAGIPMMSPLLPVLAAMMVMLYTGALDALQVTICSNSQDEHLRAVLNKYAETQMGLVDRTAPECSKLVIRSQELGIE